MNEETLNEKYIIKGTILGKGGFATVFLGSNKLTNEDVAIKYEPTSIKSENEHLASEMCVYIELHKGISKSSESGIPKIYD